MTRKPALFVGPEVQAIFDEFSTLFGVQLELLSTTRVPCARSGYGGVGPARDGVKTGGGQGSPGAGPHYCDLVKRALGPTACRAVDARYQASAEQSGRLERYTCHAGLQNAVLPVRLGRSLAGYLMIGPFRTAGQPPEALRLRKGLADAYGRLPLIDTARMGHILSLFTRLVDYLLTRDQVQLRGSLQGERLDRYVREHLAEPLSRHTCARYLGVSPVTVSRLVKQRHGVAFKKRVLELKLRAAERLLREEPGATVASVSERLGFCDPFHFSRLYRKYRGRTPSEARRAVRPGLS